MKTKRFLSAILAIFIFSFCACTKEDKNQLPPETQTGENTFGCKVNGVIYKCKGVYNPKAIIWPTAGVTFSGNEYITMEALARNRDGEEKRFNISFRFNGKLEKQTEGIRAHGERLAMEGSYINVTRFDKGILSGTFLIKTEFRGENVSYRIVELTEGRFDINRNKTE